MKYLPWILALLYFAVPYDAVPDFVLGPGWIDDIAVALLAWWWASRFKKAYHQKNRPSGYGRQEGAPSGDEGASKENPHEVLGVQPEASKEEIRSAYKKLVAQYHPDKVQHLGKEFQDLAHEKFVAIQKAYDQLTK